MKILVDDALGQGYRHQVEAVVRAVTAGEELGDVSVSVVRVKPGTWHVFIRPNDAGQWSVLPAPQREGLAQAIEVAIRQAGL